jgi:AAHS family 4-hydroxybenzoate transporter-like MFS transporter
MANAVNVEALIDEQPVRRFHVSVILLCALAMFADGFDDQVMGYVAPAMIQEWGLDRSVMGPVFSAGLAGMMIGAFAWSPVSDKIGRRAVILIGMIIFGAMSLATALSTNVTVLLILRLLTGIGLGAVMPNTIALTSEYAPARFRKTFVMVMWWGYTIGSGLGGGITAWLIKSYGWHSAFIFGGVLPLLLLPLLAWALPESVRLLLNRAQTPANERRITSILKRIDPTVDVRDRFVAAAGQARTMESPLSGLMGLFDRHRLLITLLLWAMFFANLMQLKFLSTWMPTLMHGNGLTQEQSIYVSSTIYAGSMLGTILITYTSDRLNAFLVMAGSFLCGGLATALIGDVGSNVVTGVLAAFAVGFFIPGSQVCANALAAQLYPTSSRASGVGWALGIGRVGSLVGPIFATFLLSAGWSVQSVFLAAAAPSIISVVSVLVLGWTLRAGQSGTDPVRTATT